MSNIEKYKKYFTKEYPMGPNSFRLLDELIRRSPGLSQGMNTASEIRSFWIKVCMIS